jgi:hypothetical protein
MCSPLSNHFWESKRSMKKKISKKRARSRRTSAPIVSQYFPSMPRKGILQINHCLPLPDPLVVLGNAKPEYSVVYANAIKAIVEPQVTKLGWSFPKKHDTYAWQSIVITSTGIVEGRRLATYAESHLQKRYAKNGDKGGKVVKLTKSQKQAILAACGDEAQSVPAAVDGDVHQLPQLADNQVLHCYGVIFPYYTWTPTGYRQESRKDRVHWPDPEFVLRRDCNSAVKTSIVYEGKRYFLSADDARQYACLEFLLTYPASIGDERIAAALLSPPGNPKSITHRHIAAIEVFPGPNTRGDRSRLLYMVIVSYKKGGVGYYLCNDIGVAITPVYLQNPPSIGVCKSDGGMVPRPYLAILGHTPERKVLVRWETGDPSWEAISSLTQKGSHWHLYYYARENKLLEVSGWKNIQKWKSYAYSSQAINSQTQFEVIENTRKQEAQLRKAQIENIATDNVPTRITRNRKVSKNQKVTTQ